jgi:hypothetical protein
MMLLDIPPIPGEPADELRALLWGLIGLQQIHPLQGSDAGRSDVRTLLDAGLLKCTLRYPRELIQLTPAGQALMPPGSRWLP